MLRRTKFRPAAVDHKSDKAIRVSFQRNNLVVTRKEAAILVVKHNVLYEREADLTCTCDST